MSKLLLSRRRLLGLSAAGASSLVLSGCDWFDGLARNQDVRGFLQNSGNGLTYAAQRALIGQQPLAREYAASEIHAGMKPNGSVDPTTADYLALKANNWADYKLNITGMVDKPVSFTLAELRNMPARSQITRHDCVEGWSCIAKWTGTPLGPVLDQAGVKSGARYAVYHCYDNIEHTPFGDTLYYETSDLVDAFHPQTILAYGLNDQVLPVQNGAPLRVRIERALGYKQAKYVHTIELVDNSSKYGNGKGGYWEDRGYDWYGGI